MKFLNDFLSGARKFLVMVTLIVIGVAFLISGHISGREFVDLLSGTTIAFFSANGVEHLTSMVKEYIGKKAEDAEE